MADFSMFHGCGYILTCLYTGVYTYTYTYAYVCVCVYMYLIYVYTIVHVCVRVCTLSSLCSWDLSKD